MARLMVNLRFVWFSVGAAIGVSDPTETQLFQLGKHSAVDEMLTPCVDTDNGAKDREGFGCADGYSNKDYCIPGTYDTDDFSPMVMCCTCHTDAPTATPTAPPSASPSGTPTATPTLAPTPAPTPAPTHTPCSSVDGSDVSEQYPCVCGTALCEADMSGRASFLPRPSSEVCTKSSSNCSQLICQGDPASWRSTYGDCSSYAKGAPSDGFCKDKDVDTDMEAYKVCEECQVCYRPPSPAPTPAPTEAPTLKPTASPTPAPTHGPWDQVTHAGIARVTCRSFSTDKIECENTERESCKYECLEKALFLKHSYFQFSAENSTCHTGASCEVVVTDEDSEVYANPDAFFMVAGTTALQLTLPDFSNTTSAPRLQARDQQETTEFQCGPGRGGARRAGCTASKVDIDRSQFVPKELLLIDGGLPIRFGRDITSCPLGWKVFSPTSERDWVAVKAARIRSAPIPLDDMPVDIVADEDAPSEDPTDSSSSTTPWKTLDRSTWHLRSTPFRPRGYRYKRDCYVRISDTSRADDIKFAYGCSKTTSYLCQRQQVLPFAQASYSQMVQATEWLASVIMATRSGLAADPFNLEGAQLLVSGYIEPRGGRRLAAGVAGVVTTYDVAVDNVSEANALDQELTNTANDPGTAAALQASSQSDMPNGTTVTSVAVPEPSVKVEPPPPTPAPTSAPTSSPTSSPTASPTPSPTPHPTPVPRTHRPTASPTASPTDSPTVAPTAAPGSSSTNVAAQGDPHLINMHGQRFDLMVPGVHVLLQIPKAARPEETLVRVEADARALGGACADMYFQALNVTGQWARAAADGGGGFHFSVSAPVEGATTGWIPVGKVDLKVAWGHTADGTHYLNMYARHLSKTGYAVGGLLGEDDHMKESTPPAYCKKSISLSSLDSVAETEQGSIAEAN